MRTEKSKNTEKSTVKNTDPLFYQVNFEMSRKRCLLLRN